MQSPGVRADASRPPRLSIGLPVYNGERYLAQAIDSLLGQTFSDFRLIISDNASTDGTEGICRSYRQRDGRVRYHRSEANRGAAWNFNYVVQLADSPYFKWAAHDDVCAPDFVRRCIEVLDHTPRAILCFPRSYIIDEDGRILSAYQEPAKATSPVPYQRFRALVRNSGLCHMQFGVIRLEVLRQTQLHGAYPSSDMILLAELALRGELHEVGEPLFFFRDHAGKSTRANRSDAELAVWYDPRNAGTTPLRHWTLCANYLRTIARVPNPLGQKLRCTHLIAKWFLLRVPVLGRELERGGASFLRRALRRALPPSRRPGSDTGVA